MNLHLENSLESDILNWRRADWALKLDFFQKPHWKSVEFSKRKSPSVCFLFGDSLTCFRFAI